MFAYALPVLAIIRLFWRLLLTTHLVLLIGALGGLGLSIGLDLVLPAGHVPVEDGLTFVGIVLWTTYLIDTCSLLLRRSRVISA